MTLPFKERLEVIRQLAATLNQEQSFWLEDEWADVLEQREAELHAGRVQGVPWAAVEEGLLKRIQRHIDR